MPEDAWNNLEPAEDWDNEEYTGSLADTKVFTPSGALESAPGTEDVKLQEIQSAQSVKLSPLQQDVSCYDIILE